MRSIGEEQVLHPRHDLEQDATFYSFQRGNVVFEVSASDLLRTLERFHAANPAIGDDSKLIAALRAAISSSLHVLHEADLGKELANRAEFRFADVFSCGGFRIVHGAEPGSSLVLGQYSFASPGRGMTFAGGGVIFFWSKSRTPIFGVNYWIT